MTSEPTERVPAEGAPGAKRPAAGMAAGPLLDRKQLAALLGRSTASIDRDRSAKLLPRESKLGVGKRPRWRRDEILAWLDAGMPSQRQWDATAKPKRG